MRNFRRHRGRRNDERRGPGPRPPQQNAPAEQQGGPDFVFGIEPVRELLGAAVNSIETLYLRAGDEQRFEAEADRVRIAGSKVVIAREGELERMVGRDARHQGIVAMVREYPYTELEDIVGDGSDPIVLVDGVTDPRNLGALMRSAEGAGVGAIVIARDRTAGVTPAAVKASAGAWAHLRIARCGNVARTLETFKEAGYWIVALAPGGDVPLYQLDTSRKLVIVVGSEGEGIRPIVLKAADFVVSIPMRGKVGSLNVSVAAAVALFEIGRRRSQVGS